MDWGETKAPKRITPVRVWQCHVCKQDTGQYSSVAVRVMSPVVVNTNTGNVDRKLTKEKAVCAQCLARGKVTEVF